MPTRNVNLTGKLDRFVADKVEAGLYDNASEVVRAGLRTLQREEQEFQAKLVALRAAIDEGDSSGIARGDVFARVRKALKLPAARQPWRLFAFPSALNPTCSALAISPFGPGIKPKTRELAMQ
jgi:antitoxin ParD1/3/4